MKDAPRICAICMDAIEVDPGLRRRSKSGEGERRGFLKLGTVAGAAAARKSYSLAPCHLLFVSSRVFLFAWAGTLKGRCSLFSTTSIRRVSSDGSRSRCVVPLLTVFYAIDGCWLDRTSVHNADGRSHLCNIHTLRRLDAGCCTSHFAVSYPEILSYYIHIFGHT